ncbi:MAG: hypothetical protein LBU32_21205 [Clostridiales bacterium]|nr:hypothetical protein [Clostridiales bacterium]
MPADGRAIAERRLDQLSEKRRSAREPAVFDRGCPSFELIHRWKSWDLHMPCAPRRTSARTPPRRRRAAEGSSSSAPDPTAWPRESYHKY